MSCQCEYTEWHFSFNSKCYNSCVPMQDRPTPFAHNCLTAIFSCGQTRGLTWDSNTPYGRWLFKLLWKDRFCKVETRYLITTSRPYSEKNKCLILSCSYQTHCATGRGLATLIRTIPFVKWNPPRGASHSEPSAQKPRKPSTVVISVSFFVRLIGHKFLNLRHNLQGRLGSLGYPLLDKGKNDACNITVNIQTLPSRMQGWVWPYEPILHYWWTFRCYWRQGS